MCACRCGRACTRVISPLGDAAPPPPSRALRTSRHPTRSPPWSMKKPVSSPCFPITAPPGRRAARTPAAGCPCKSPDTQRCPPEGGRVGPVPGLTSRWQQQPAGAVGSSSPRSPGVRGSEPGCRSRWAWRRGCAVGEGDWSTKMMMKQHFLSICRLPDTILGPRHRSPPSSLRKRARPSLCRLASKETEAQRPKSVCRLAASGQICWRASLGRAAPKPSLSTPLASVGFVSG